MRIALVLIGLAASLTSCIGPECRPERCAASAALVSVLAAASGERLPDAIVETSPSAVVGQGCVFGGNAWGCTHELLEIPGNDGVLNHRDGVEPGHGAYVPNADIRFEVRVSAPGFVAQSFEAHLRTTECGNVIPKHWVVRLSASGPAQANVETAPAPPMCGD